jgi:hypothetical protein
LSPKLQKVNTAIKMKDFQTFDAYEEDILSMIDLPEDKFLCNESKPIHEAALFKSGVSYN